MQAEHLAGKKLCIVSILRAGNGILEGMLDLVPSARVGHIGLYRDHVTLRPVEYYLKLPSDMAERLVILVDPMLATGHSAAAAASAIEAGGGYGDEVRLPAGGARGDGRVHRGASGCAGVYRRDRPASWTTTAISGRGWAMPATGSTAPGSIGLMTKFFAPPRGRLCSLPSK